MYVLLAEILWVLFAEEAVKVFARFRQHLRARYEQLVVLKLDDALKMRHLVGSKVWPNLVAYEQQARVRVVYDVVNLRGLELVEDGDGDSAVAEYCEEGTRPSCAVSST